jgi:hypothetical protein
MSSVLPAKDFVSFVIPFVPPWLLFLRRSAACAPL